MRLSKEVTTNIILFIIIILLEIFNSLLISNKTISLHFLTLEISHYLITFILYIVNYKYVAFLILNKKYGQYLLFFVGLVIIYGLLRYLIQEVIIFEISGKHNYFFDKMTTKKIIINLSFDSLYYTLQTFLLSIVIYILHRFNENKEKLNQLNLTHQKTQLNALKSQLNPHFLFNTLNNFYVELIDNNPKTAEDILKLSNLMRYITYESTSDFIPLSKEIDFIKDYIHFYKRRYEEDLNIQLIIKGTIGSEKIPSLTLLHFIENICKHGIINNKTKPAKIIINILTDSLEVSTENHCNTSEKYSSKGIGTKNITKRLQALCNHDFTLSNTESNNIYSSYLKIPLRCKNN